MSHKWIRLIVLLFYVFTIVSITSLKSEEEKKSVTQFMPGEKLVKPYMPEIRYFFRFNSDLRRIGYEEFTSIAYPYLGTEVQRISTDYKLGLGDTVMIVLSGKIQDSYKLTIDQDGKIMLPLIGEIYLLGLSVEQSKNTIQNEVDKKYSNVKVGFNLASVQQIRISVLGNSRNPGIHLVSPFSRLVEGIAKAGGPTSQGTLINIKLLRDKREIVKFNVYDYLFKAEEKNNILLKNSDTIFIPEIKNLVAVRGDVVASGIYEIEDNTKVSEVIKIARGLIPRNIVRKVQVIRLDASSGLFKKIKEIKISPSGNFENNEDFILENEDTIMVATLLENIPYPEEIVRVVVINGWVNNPGEYLIKEGETLSSLIKRAGGLKEGAYPEGMIFIRPAAAQSERRVIEEKIKIMQETITREQTELSEAVIPIEEKAILQKKIDEKKKFLDILKNKNPTGRVIVDFQKILNGEDDIILEKGAEIYIPREPDWVLVVGEVNNNISVKFVPDKDIKYYLNQVSGITKKGDEEGIYVTKANGRIEYKSTGYSKISPGDTIVVPEKENIESKSKISETTK